MDHRLAWRLLFLALLAAGLGSGPLASSIGTVLTPAVLAAPERSAGGVVYVAELNGPITPLAARYLRRVQRAAEDAGAAALLIRLDTPGGLDSAMRQITQDLLGAAVPTIVYVAPSGARAASAGMFVTLAAQVAAMAPGTNIGAAHPVGTGGERQAAMSAPSSSPWGMILAILRKVGMVQADQPVGSTSLTKATEDAAALARSLATTYGRNAAWAERAVRESVALTAAEARERQVIDLVATDVPDLLRQLHGRNLQVRSRPVTLQTQAVTIRLVPMNWLEQLLAIISDPNIALILMSLGTIGLVAEFLHPGTVLPGVFGGIALVLGLVALGNLPFNWAGLVLLALAAGLLTAELHVAGFGVFGVGAIIAFVLGSALLFTPFAPVSPMQLVVAVRPSVVATIAAAMAAFVLLVVRAVVQAREAPISTGVERLVGASGVTLEALRPGRVGRVRVAQEEWSAEGAPHSLPQEIPAETTIEVVAVKGVTLVVRPLPAPAPAPHMSPRG